MGRDYLTDLFSHLEVNVIQSSKLIFLMRIKKMKEKKRHQLQTYMRISEVEATQSNSHTIIQAN